MTSLQALRKLQKDIRKRLRTHGTDVDLNDRDSTGDGDQSPIKLNHKGQQVYRDLFAYGGDIAECTTAGQISRFAGACATGDVEYVEKALKEADTDPKQPSQRLVSLLESRETSMRLSPLLFIVSAGKNISVGGANLSSFLSSKQISVARILLKYGARPDAKDVCGKTACHYGAGMMATEMTLEVVTLCIHAAESSYLFGREVELFGLNNKSMNGKRGIARGFDTATGRRAVYVFGEERQVALKPENIRLFNNTEEFVPPKLCDIQDRLGAVSLIEVLMSNRDDVAKFLLQKHRARIDIPDVDGCSPQSMALLPNADLASSVARLIKERAAKDARAKTKAAKSHCSQCSKEETADSPLRLCDRCKSVCYCSRDCQLRDWTEGGHKEDCQRLAAARSETVILEQPDVSPLHTRFFHTASGKVEPQPNGAYQKPDYADINEPFYVKVQCTSRGQPMYIYDKSRQCQFEYTQGKRGYSEMYEKVKAEKAFGGRKTYIAVSFDETGKCTVYLGMTTVKKW